MKRLVHSLVAVAVLAPAALSAQFHGITFPPDGGNQHATVSQWIGLVEVTIDYHSPHVHAPDGTDRTGKIWGGLVPYGLANLGFGTCGDQCPWRGGANENTTFTVDHDVLVQGQPLPAGAYGLHFIPGADEWTIVFSKDSTSWGSFFYDAKDDALRVTAKPEKGEYREVLTYEFPERRLGKATAALKWENLALPWTIEVPNANDLYVENIRRQLKTSPGFSWEAWNDAAQFCLTNKVNLAEGLAWAEAAAHRPGLGQENWTTLVTLSRLEAANDKADDAKKTWTKALASPSASPFDLHAAGRQLLADKKVDLALQVFETNAKRNPGAWPVEVGLGRGYAAAGRTKDAIQHLKIAVGQAPDEGNKKNLQGLIEKLEKGEKID